MPRVARIVGIGYLHHVVQRGNNREEVFFDKEDYKRYLSFLKRYSKERKSPILAYCLMSNHVHLLVRPLEELSLPKMMQGLALCYTQYFNRKYNRSGRLWECRYHSSVIDEEGYLWAVSRYIEKNPVRAGTVRKSEKYPYSSAPAHILGKKDPVLGEALFDDKEISNYKRFMLEEEKEEELERIRRQTRLGKPLGDEKFLDILCRRLNRDLIFRPRGRPKKEGKK